MTASSATTRDQEASRFTEPCGACGGTVLVFTGDFVTWGRCLSCERTGIVAWVSCQPLTVGSNPLLSGGDWRPGAPPR